MSRVYRTPEELVQIYRYHQSGLTVLQIAQTTGFDYGSVSAALKSLNRYLTGKTRDRGKRSQNYLMAVKLIRKQDREEPSQTITEGTIWISHSRN